jgi:acyl dehydratase
MIDRSFIGWTSAPATVEVDHDRLRRFAQAIGETNPIYTDEQAARASGYPGLPAPPTLAFCLEMEKKIAYQMLDKMGVPLNSILHGEQTFIYHQPILAGDRLTLQARVLDIYAKKGGALEFIVNETVMTNQRGERAIEMQSVLVVRREVAREQ